MFCNFKYLEPVTTNLLPELESEEIDYLLGFYRSYTVQRPLHFLRQLVPLPETAFPRKISAS